MSARWPKSAVVRRVLPAPPTAVYDEWLDPDALVEFMCPLPARATRVECEPRIGGHFLIQMMDGDAVIQMTGEYLELDRPHRLKFTWNSDSHGGIDSVVTISLEPTGRDQTLMTIDHALPAHLVDDHQQGWNKIAERLGSRFATSSPRKAGGGWRGA
jgi:uncharacterized protein YndB with AHSA1/START domain